MILTFFSYSSNNSQVKPLYQQTTILIDNSKTTFQFFCSCLQILLDMTVATHLITSGIRNTIVSIYNTIIVPIFLYCLELVELTKAEMEYLDSQAKNCLKSLFNISKRSKNDIHRLYSIPNVCSTIDERRLNLLRQLVLSKSTKRAMCDFYCPLV